MCGAVKCSPSTRTKRPKRAAAEITVCGSPIRENTTKWTAVGLSVFDSPRLKETYEATTQKTWYEPYPERAA